MNLQEKAKSSLLSLGDFSIFIWEIAASLRKLWYRRGLLLKQCEFIGVGSLGVNMVAASFLGAVMGYQLYVSFHLFGAEALLGGSVGVSLFREFGPVMTGIMVTGRAGAAMAAEIASMRISEQVDALEVMAIDPIEFLVTPRVVAGLVMVPLLSVFFSIVGCVMAAFIACYVMGLSGVIYWTQLMKVVDAIDVVHCVVKGATFGLVMTIVGCFYGYRASGGARAVGAATRSTVVTSCLSILFSDYLLTSLLPYGFPTLKV